MKTVITLFLTALLLCTTAFAADEKPDELSGMDSAKEALSDEAREYADKNGADSISFGSLITDLVGVVKDKASAPLKLFGVLCAIAVLYSALENFRDGSSCTEVTGVYGAAACACASAAAITHISGIIEETVNTVKMISLFMKSFVPVLSGVIAVGGNVGAASVYNLSLLGCCELITVIAESFCFPLLGCYLALCVCSGLNDDLQLSGLAKGIKTAVITIIGICMTAFVGLLTVQGFVAKAGDSVAMKTAKFAVGSFVPIVGSAISDALASVQGSIGLIKASTGAYGIIAGIATVLPALVLVLLTKLAAEASAVAADIFGVPRMASLYRSFGAVLTVLTAIILSVTVALIVSTAVMLIMCGG